MKVLQAICDFKSGSAESTDGERADRAVQRLTGLSRAGLRGLFDHGCVTVNGMPCLEPQHRLHQGDIVRVQYDPNRRYKERPTVKADPAFELLYEDSHVLVVNKAAHVFTVPTATEKGKTLIDALERHVDRSGITKKPRLHMIQRLDRGVSGVLVVAKSAKAAEALRHQFASHKPQRIYIAIVAGVLEKSHGTFRSYMATGKTLQRYSTKSSDRGELAITHYQTLPGRQSDTATVVRVQLETGRRNQIRVHFAEAGHPVLGDKRYRPDLALHPRWKARRLALHAQRLEFAHPTTGKVMHFEAPLPAEFTPIIGR